MLVTKRKEKRVCFTVMAALFVFHFAVLCWGQALDLQVSKNGDNAIFNVTGATPSTTVSVCLEAVSCVGDVDGDRIVTNSDSGLVANNFGPCHTWTSRVYDLNNDGFVNSADVDIVEFNMGCSSPASTPIPGCSISADIDAAVAIILSVSVDAAGSGSLSMPIPGGYDATFYVQAIDVVGCAKTALAVNRFMHSDTAVQPLSSLTTVSLSDFGSVIPNGLVEIATADGTQKFAKDANGQIAGVVDAVPGDTAAITLYQTNCSFLSPDGTGTVVQGRALGSVEDMDIENTENSTAYVRHLFQPVMTRVSVGDNNPMGMHVMAPFHGLWELFVPDPYSRLYASFSAYLGLLLSDSQIARYLNYYGVKLHHMEDATNAVYVSPDRTVNLGNGSGYGAGFIVRVRTDAMEYGADTPYVKILSLYQNAANINRPFVTVQNYDHKYLTLHVTGTLPKAEHLILLSGKPFNKSYSAVVVNLQPAGTTMGEPGVLGFDESGPAGRDFRSPEMGPREAIYRASAVKDCDPPKPDAPTMSDECTGSLPLLWYLDDCIITGNYTKSTSCDSPTTVQGALKCGVPDQEITKTVKVEWKGTVSVGFDVKGVSGSIGEEISISEEDSDKYTFKDGNGCGQCIAWWIHVKMCLTTYAIKYHEYEWIFPVGWCNLCCNYVRSACVAQTVISTTVCDRTCN